MVISLYHFITFLYCGNWVIKDLHSFLACGRLRIIIFKNRPVWLVHGIIYKPHEMKELLREQMEQDFTEEREKMVEEQLIPRGISSTSVLNAMRSLPNYHFIFYYVEGECINGNY